MSTPLRLMKGTAAGLSDIKEKLRSWQKNHRSSVAECFHRLYLEYGYRKTNSFVETFLSLFTFHNETMNIWSHLIGFVCILVAGVHVATEMVSSENQQMIEIVVFSSFVGSAAICLLLSTIYHWFGCLSEACHTSLLRMDLTGIGLLVSGSFFPAIYYGKSISIMIILYIFIYFCFDIGFYCTPEAQYTHWALTVFVFCVGICAPWIETKINGVPIRHFIFVTLVVLGAVPFTHWLMITPDIYKNEVLTVIKNHHNLLRMP